jgi:hypothetical protein
MAEAAAVHSHAHQPGPAHHGGPAWFGQVGRFAGIGIIVAGVGSCRSARRMFCRPASPARWWRTARACNGQIALKNSSLAA